MSKKKIVVVVKEPGKPPEKREIDNTLESMQNIVDGYIEMVHYSASIWVVCNEEGKLKGLQVNFHWRDDIIVGTAFFTKISPSGNNVSLSDSQVEDIISLFN